MMSEFGEAAGACSGPSVPYTTSTTEPSTSYNLERLRADCLGSLTFWLGPGSVGVPEQVPAFNRLNELTILDAPQALHQAKGGMESGKE
jgi:hypothetical protein